MSADSQTHKKARAYYLKLGLPCHICGLPIDYSLPREDPWAYQLDHVIPVALGGKDGINTSRPSHRTCNRAKGANLVAPIIRRSGSYNLPTV